MKEQPDHLISWLRKLQLDWEMDLPKLSTLSHIPENILASYLALDAEKVSELPSIPNGLEPAVALIGIFRRVQGVYPEPEAQNEWLVRENQTFEGNRPIDVMAMSPGHLSYVSYVVESGLRLV